MVVIHDVPIIGVFTTSFRDGFDGLIWSHPTSQEIEEAFNAAKGLDGKLNRTGVAQALRLLGKAERQLQNLVDYMPEDELDLAGFTELVVPAPQPWTYEVGPVPVPNLGKVLEVPVLGHTLNMTNYLLAMPTDGFLRSFRRTTYPANDHIMKQVFLSADSEHSSKLDKGELASALRKFYKTESEVKTVLDALKDEVSLYEFKKLVRGPKYSPSVVNYVPMVGPALATNLLSVFDSDLPEEDQMEAFEYIDRSKNGKLDKTEVADLLRELGKSETEVQKLVDAMPSEELDLEGFKEFLQTAGTRHWLTSVYGVPVPNPAKVHDTPLVGSFTSFAQDVVVDTYDWTAGSAVKYFKSVSDDSLKATFDQFDEHRTGMVSKKEVSKGLRSLGMTEREISRLRDGMGDKEKLDLEEFKRLVRTGSAMPPDENAAHPLQVLGFGLQSNERTTSTDSGVA
mmetsp:Transcript_72044/g.166893  ORF Transcript_72044/g.166893 Transcript_72044/m.166893 type:complete len:453 (+) Transcript_72044:50-1408(+)|eukprot:CAMPEP_0171103804 /NCGR_PEP_ID=MMETSP0766_2-20121228/59416_1 /TAXON_ID=439317 /ORGANISM="Gambierdiscus australes, Strain CAWD 149" /LENGTH=452 /DNA_ID=CAMNT_0011564303 /DNA_START=49 /DNA_END=1407 /DNA_ORIENTATION=-